MKRIYLIILLVMHVGFAYAGQNEIKQKPELQIEPGIYIFVSFSMNDESLRSYFTEAGKYSAKLVMRGLAGEKNSRNRFAATRAKLEQARVNIDINPTLFEAFNIKHVPYIVKVSKDGQVSKIGGHITLQKALELMSEERSLR